MASTPSVLTTVPPLPGRVVGVLSEARLFAFLLDYPYAFRSFEFAPADGTVSATKDERPQAGNFSERFWHLDQQIRLERNSERHQCRLLVPFDFKSKVSCRAEDQIYVTSLRQRSSVAAYIGVCAADPAYVELYPNFFTEAGSAKDKPSRYVAVNVSRKSLLQPPAYGYLSPCNAAYRMPLEYLVEAFDNLRECARGHGDYVNPWTGAQFPSWRPLVVHSNESMAPAEDSQHYTAYRGVMEIWRGVLSARSLGSTDMDFDWMWLAPRIADFKLLVPQAHPQQRRQVFVQYKIDGRERSLQNDLTRVAIARNMPKGGIRYYFTDAERFDYLLYQFDFKDHHGDPCSKIFFIPERALPDEFYETRSIEGNFKRDDFEKFSMVMDDELLWVEKIRDIIVETPEPRKSGGRPHRIAALDEAEEAAPSLRLVEPSIANNVTWFYEKFFTTVMERCASRGFGLLVVLAHEHPIADFAYCHYRWTLEERDGFLTDGRTPCTITQLPASTPVVPLLVYSRSCEGTTRGPWLTSTEFRRLNSCFERRLLICNLLGDEGRDVHGPLCVIPSDDMRPTDKQRKGYAKNLAKDKRVEYEDRVPLVAELLHTGSIYPDYTISASGSLIFEDSGNPWGGVLELLDRFAGREDFEHPLAPPRARVPKEYRISVRKLHQCYVDEQAWKDCSKLSFAEVTDSITSEVKQL